MGKKDTIQSKGGRARSAKLSPEERRDIAKRAAAARWRRPDALTESPPQGGIEPPEAAWKGVLRLMDLEIPCYVLTDGRRVIGRTAATELLTDIKGGGALEKYIGSTNLNPFINRDLVLERMVAFRLPEVEGLNREVKGLSTELLVEVFQGLVSALEASTREGSGVKLTARQQAMAVRAGMFLSACSRVGLDALVDEATGYQYQRASDALEVKLKAYLSDEMRKWEKTFPDELWVEFGRLTGWKGSVSRRPKYWGHLVNELIYDALDPDVATWLKENAPAPRHGQNYHQWMTSQFGLKKLIEHIWMVVGMAKACDSMNELKRRVGEMSGRVPVQLNLLLPPPSRSRDDY